MVPMLTWGFLRSNLEEVVAEASAANERRLPWLREDEREWLRETLAEGESLAARGCVRGHRRRVDHSSIGSSHIRHRS